MDIKQIQELVKLVNKSNIGELSIEKEGFKITIKQKKEPAQHFGCSCITASSSGSAINLPQPQVRSPAES